jgi:hypothetical protein
MSSKPDLSFSWSVSDWHSYEVGQKVVSDPVVWQGFKWSICLYPSGTVAENQGKVGCFVTVKSASTTTPVFALDVTFALSICERPPAKATCCFRNDADIWGFKDIMLRDALDPTKPITAHAQIYLSKFPAPSSLESPAPPKHPLLSISSYFNDESSSDITLKCESNSGEAKTWRVHKLVLIATSEYFKALFKGNWSESASGELREMEIKDCEPHILEHVLQYLYNGEQGLPVSLTWDEACEILEASSFFQIPSLQDVLINKLSTLLNAENLVGIYVIAKRLELTKLASGVLEFVRSRYGTIRDQRKQILTAIREDSMNCDDLLDCFVDAAEQFSPLPIKKTL